MKDVLMGQLFEDLKFINKGLFTIWRCKGIDFGKSFDCKPHAISNSNNFIDRCKVAFSKFLNGLILIVKPSLINLGGQYSDENVNISNIFSKKLIPVLLVDVELEPSFEAKWIFLKQYQFYWFTKQYLKFQIEVKLDFVVQFLMIRVQGHQQMLIGYHHFEISLWETWAGKLALEHNPIHCHACYLECLCSLEGSNPFWVLDFHFNLNNSIYGSIQFDDLYSRKAGLSNKIYQTHGSRISFQNIRIKYGIDPNHDNLMINQLAEMKTDQHKHNHPYNISTTRVETKNMKPPSFKTQLVYSEQKMIYLISLLKLTNIGYTAIQISILQFFIEFIFMVYGSYLGVFNILIQINMRGLLIVALLAVFSTAVLADNWAVLVAGSNTWANYRHQSDVFHAYQILIKNNFNPDRIITFAYDDIAKNIKNPFKGKVFNKPTFKEPGVDVYQGVKIDYSGTNVNPTLFKAVLEGNKTAVSGKGTSRVLESTSEDNVFLYFADHGAPGLIAFPSHYLHADELMTSFNKMKGNYNKLVFYLQACQSGSMFTKLPNDTKIYALSAANPSESSWGTYCSPQDVVQGKHIGSCLGDLFSINFLENTEQIDVNKMSLNDQFDVIKQKTTKSHVMQWGDMSFSDDVIGEYVSENKGNSFINLRRPTFRFFQREKNLESVDSRFITVRTLSQIYAREQTKESLAELRDQMKSMQRFDEIFSAIKKQLNLKNQLDIYNLNFDCNRAFLDSFEQKCGRLSDYGLIYVKAIAEACQKVNSNDIMQVLQQIDC